MSSPRHLLVLLLGACALGVVGFLGFKLGEWIDPYPLRSAVVTLSGLLLLAAIGAAPALIYARGRKVGLRVRGATALAVIPPLLWYGKEIIRMSEYLSGGLLVYGALHQVELTLWFWLLVLLGATELLRRLREGRIRRRQEPGAAAADSPGRAGLRFAGPGSALLLGLSGLGLFVFIQGGVLFAQWYMALYSLLFQ